MDAGNLNKPEDIARATIRLVNAAKLEDAGKRYWPTTDFAEW
jgi:hypothetical protein